MIFLFIAKVSLTIRDKGEIYFGLTYIFMPHQSLIAISEEDSLENDGNEDV